MSTISNLIFNNQTHYITSSYGKRSSFSTSAGVTSSFHNGTDYGTNGKKLPQYAIEDGVILSCGKASDGAKFVWVKYPRINKKFLHYHLDTISVKKGQAVTKGTKLGTTGKSGKATGIHLHLGVKDLTTNAYENPEKLKYTLPVAYKTGTYKVTASLLNVRKGAGTSYSKKKFIQLTANAKSQIKKLNGGKAADGLVKGCVCSVKQVKGEWGKIPSGWICLRYCERV